MTAAPRVANGPGSARRRAWDEARDVLCVRLDALGDVLMSGPAMRALGRAGQHRRVTLLTSPAGAAAARLIPWVDDVLVYEAPWVKATAVPQDTRSHERLVTDLRGRGFDAAVIFTVYSQSPLPAALTCHLADIPLRLAHCRENPYGLLTDWVPEPEPQERVRHEVRRQLDLVAAVGAHTGDERLRVTVPPGARRRVAALLDRLGLGSGGRWAAVHPGASAPSRRYPPEAYAAACRRLIEDHDVAPVFTGEPGERDLVDAIRSTLPAKCHSLAGLLGLPELAALLAAAPVLVAGNSGPVHVAAAVGTPVVDLYALTNPQHGPWGVRSTVLFRDVPCRWCYKSVCPEGHHRCLRGVTPWEVADAAAAFVEDAPSTRAPGGDPLGLWRAAPGTGRRDAGHGSPGPGPSATKPLETAAARPIETRSAAGRPARAAIRARGEERR